MEAHTANVKRVALTILLTARGTPVLLTKASAQRSIIHACGSTQSHHKDTAAHTVAAKNHCVSRESAVKQQDTTAQAVAHAAAQAHLCNVRTIRPKRQSAPPYKPH